MLLRIDAEAGHGIGSTKSQNDQFYADIVSFIKWRTGVPGWSPTATAQRGTGGERGR